MRKLLVGLCILIIPTLFMISPVSAAQKIYDVTIHDQLSVSYTYGTICGVTDEFTANLEIKVLQFTVWDNGHSRVHITSQLNFVDSAGDVIARETQTNHDIESTGGLPFSFEFTQTVTCTGASATPGLMGHASFGSTIGVDGTLTEFHTNFHP